MNKAIQQKKEGRGKRKQKRKEGRDKGWPSSRENLELDNLEAAESIHKHSHRKQTHKNERNDRK